MRYQLSALLLLVLSIPAHATAPVEVEITGQVVEGEIVQTGSCNVQYVGLNQIRGPAGVTYSSTLEVYLFTDESCLQSFILAEWAVPAVVRPYITVATIDPNIDFGGGQRVKVRGYFEQSGFVGSMAGNSIELDVPPPPPPPLPAFLTIGLHGGAALATEIVPLTAAPDFLPAYDGIGLGSEMNFAYRYGAYWSPSSPILAALGQNLYPQAEQHLAAVGIAAYTPADSMSPGLDLSRQVLNAGRAGGLFPYVVRQSSKYANSPLGGANVSAVPYTVFNSLQTAPGLWFGYDYPYLKSALDPIWTSPQPAGVTNDNLEAGLVAELVLQHIGAGYIGRGGYDNHGVPRSVADSRDYDAGVLIARALNTAYVENTALFIAVVTDGSMITTGGSDSRNSSFAGDVGSTMVLLFTYDPEHQIQRDGTIIGAYGVNQSVDLSIAPGSDQNLLGAAILTNYLSFSGREDLIDSATFGILNGNYGPQNTDLKTKFMKLRR